MKKTNNDAKLSIYIIGLVLSELLSDKVSPYFYILFAIFFILAISIIYKKWSEEN